MKVLGYVIRDTVGKVYHRTDDVDMFTSPEDALPISDGEAVCAVVPVADLDVEQAIERAAKASCLDSHRAAEPLGGSLWPCRDAHHHRAFVRPIVLAALGVTP